MRSSTRARADINPSEIHPATDKSGKGRRSTRRNLAALALFVYGSTFLWLTAAFAGTAKPPGGITWAVTDTFAYLSIVMFSGAAWSIFKSRSWWENIAAAAAVLGSLGLIPYLIAALSLGLPGPGINTTFHVVGNAIVLSSLLIPELRRRVEVWL